MASFAFVILAVIFGAIILGLVVAFVLVPLFRGIGWIIVNCFQALGWLIAHLFEFVSGTIGDVLRLISAIITAVVLLPFAPLNVLLGRWSAAGHFAESIKRECKVAGTCLYRILLRRPLKLFWLHGILEGVEQRLPEAMAAAPTRDKPSRRTGQFDGYNIVGSLRGGGSGAKLYIAEPLPAKHARIKGMPDRVVIKAFALTEGSSLPQIVRESRALECAKQLGLVFDHGMDAHRFFYVMPYHAGDHLGIVTRQLHGQSDGNGLKANGQRTVMAYVVDLLETLAVYHRGGLWHKDVKPENVIIREDRAHLVDLGLITPLRSAMTLTTHGTEYFRDPEMVRQALRGVKVHQVDGAKFDLYAVGAVLYFMLENTFPAHGGLSRFAKSSPEAACWIVRRAMADYQQRYETAEDMLADLRVVAAAPDPFAVRPVELPSMGGASYARDESIDREPVRVDVAGSPAPPAATVTPEPVEAAPAAAEPKPSWERPKIRVTNWWTGAYVVDDAEGMDGGAGGQEQSRMLREHARDLRDQARDHRERVRRGVMPARKAAREQIQQARARARELQRRVRTRGAVAERQPSAFLAVLVVLFLLIGGAIFLTLVRSVGRSQGTTTTIITNGYHLDGLEDEIAIAASEQDGGTRVMLAIDGEELGSEAVRQIKRFVNSTTLEGYQVVLAGSDENEHVVHLLEARSGSNGPVGIELEDVARSMDVEGVLWVEVDGRSSHPEVQVREFVVVGAPAPDGSKYLTFDDEIPEAPRALRLLLVNDHPAKADRQVEQRIVEIVQRHVVRNWDVVLDDDAETAVRQVLPPGPAEDGCLLPARLHRVLADHDLAGILKIDASGGDGSPEERIVWTRIDALPVETN